MFQETALRWAEFATANHTAVVVTAIVAAIAFVSSGSFVKDNPVETVARWVVAAALAFQAWFAYHGESSALYHSALFAVWATIAAVACCVAMGLAGWGRSRMEHATDEPVTEPTTDPVRETATA